MKKLLAALLLAAFAIIIAANAYSLNLTAQVFGGFNVLEASSNFDRSIELFDLNSGKIKLQAGANNNNFGGLLRLGYDFSDDYFIDFDIWWRQSPKFALYFTYNEDGHFALDNIAGKNFYGFPGEVLGLQGCSSSRAFYSGFNHGVFAVINPFSALTIYGGINLFRTETPEYMFKSMTLQLVYSLGTKGKMGLTIEGDYMTEDSLDDNPNLTFYYNHTRIKDVDLDFGISYRIWDTRDTSNINGNKHTRYHPINLGVGAVFTVKDVKFKTRLHINFLGHDRVEFPDGVIMEHKRAFDINFDILPAYTFRRDIIGYLNAGFGLSFPEEGETDVFWRLNPYVIIGNQTTAAFYAGVDLYSPAFYPWEVRLTAAVGLSITF